MLNPNKFDSIEDFRQALLEDEIKQGWVSNNDIFNKFSEIGKNFIDKLFKKERG